jgi:hypothetical protein
MCIMAKSSLRSALCQKPTVAMEKITINSGYTRIMDFTFGPGCVSRAARGKPMGGPILNYEVSHVMGQIIFMNFS